MQDLLACYRHPFPVSRHCNVPDWQSTTYKQVLHLARHNVVLPDCPILGTHDERPILAILSVPSADPGSSVPTYRSTNAEMRVNTFVDGLGLSIFADRIDTNCRVGATSNNPSSVRCVGQYRCARCVYVNAALSVTIVVSQSHQHDLRAGRPRGRRGSKLIANEA